MSELYRSMENILAKNVLCRIQAIHLSQQHCTKEVYAATVCEAANWVRANIDSRKRNTKVYSAPWKLWRRCVKLLESEPLSKICFQDATGSWCMRPPESIMIKTHYYLRGKPVPEFQPKTGS